MNTPPTTPAMFRVHPKHCNGPCNQGRNPCTTPEACEIVDDRYFLYDQRAKYGVAGVSLLLASALVSLASILVIVATLEGVW